MFPAVKCKNQWAVTYTATGVAFVVRTINLSGRDGNVLGFKPMRVMGVLVMLVKKEAYFAQMKILHRLHTLYWTLLVSFD